MEKVFKYEQHGSEGTNNNPMLPIWRVKLGADENGKEWLCQIRPTHTFSHLAWNVDFDTTDEYNATGIETDDPDFDPWSSPFLRTEVLYSKDYWVAVRKFYHRETVEYKDIEKTIRKFVSENGIA